MDEVAVAYTTVLSSQSRRGYETQRDRQNKVTNADESRCTLGNKDWEPDILSSVLQPAAFATWNATALLDNHPLPV